ncbi:MAG: hypothetical protein H0U73_12145 [Tatlockia sp.]|nr:hypothetical protein [Tatlockia sp.]
MFVFAGTLFADTSKHANSAKTAKNSGSITCEQFLAVDEVNQPKIIYYTVGQMKKGKSKKVDVIIADTERLIPVVIDACKKTPKKTLWQKLKQHF